MGIDLATWRARIGLNYYHKCHPLQTRWRSSGGWLNQPGVASWGVGEVMNDTSLVLKGCMTVVALSLILQHIICFWSKLNGRGGCGKVRSHWQEYSSQVKGTVDGGWTLLLRCIVVVIPLLLVMAGDVETNPGPGGNIAWRQRMLEVSKLIVQAIMISKKIPHLFEQNSLSRCCQVSSR